MSKTGRPCHATGPASTWGKSRKTWRSRGTTRQRHSASALSMTGPLGPFRPFFGNVYYQPGFPDVFLGYGQWFSSHPPFCFGSAASGLNSRFAQDAPDPEPGASATRNRARPAEAEVPGLPGRQGRVQGSDAPLASILPAPRPRHPCHLRLCSGTCRTPPPSLFCDRLIVSIGGPFQQKAAVVRRGRVPCPVGIWAGCPKAACAFDAHLRQTISNRHAAPEGRRHHHDVGACATANRPSI